MNLEILKIAIAEAYTETRSMWNPLNWFNNDELNIYAPGSLILDIINNQELDSDEKIIALINYKTEINNALDKFSAKTYRPWWCLFLIVLYFFSKETREEIQDFQLNLNSILDENDPVARKQLVDNFAKADVNSEIMALSEAEPTKAVDKSNLNTALNHLKDSSNDQAQRELIKAVIRQVKILPLGGVIISASSLCVILTRYLSNQANKLKTAREQASDIWWILAEVGVKETLRGVTKILLPGIGEVVATAGGMIVTRSTGDPLTRERKLGTVVSGAAGAAAGAVCGTLVLPVIGTYIGAQAGAIIGSASFKQLYSCLVTVVDAQSTVPPPSQTLTGTLVSRVSGSRVVLDTDYHYILKPLYENFVQTEVSLKALGKNISLWINKYGNISPEDADYNTTLKTSLEELALLKQEYSTIKNIHGTTVRDLCSQSPDNRSRVLNYKNRLKSNLESLHAPIKQLFESEIISTTLALAQAQAQAQAQERPDEVAMRVSTCIRFSATSTTTEAQVPAEIRVSPRAACIL